MDETIIYGQLLALDLWDEEWERFEVIEIYEHLSWISTMRVKGLSSLTIVHVHKFLYPFTIAIH